MFFGSVGIFNEKRKTDYKFMSMKNIFLVENNSINQNESGKLKKFGIRIAFLVTGNESTMRITMNFLNIVKNVHDSV